MATESYDVEIVELNIMGRNKYSFEEYCNHIREKKNPCDVPENVYKDAFIPKKLYKYWTFGSSHIDENLKEICRGRIWMPVASTLNDPFEFQMMKDDLSAENKMDFRKDTLNRNSILSLCASCNNNLMWSQYAFAHKGMCLEFEVESTERIFPVIYKRYQEDATQDILQWLAIKKEILLKQSEEMTPDERYMVAKLQKIMLVKKTDWKHEKEFRIIGRIPDYIKDEERWDIPSGYWERLSLLGIKLRRIILGFNCNLQDKARVIEFVNKSNEALIMSEMIRTEYKQSEKNVINTLMEEGALILIAQKVRKKDTLSLSVKNYRLKGYRYEF